MRNRFVEIIRSIRPVRCVVVLFISAGVLFGGSSTANSQTTGAAGEQKKCTASPPNGFEWTGPEAWAWQEIRSGRPADFNKCLGEELDPKNPAHDDQWADGRRTLSSRFLKTILIKEPFRSAIPHRGVRIIGAYFKNRINLFDNSIERPLSIKSSLFKSRMNMDRFETPGSIAFAGSRFDGTLDLNSAIIGGGLIVEGTHFNNVVWLNNITIGGDLFMGGEAKFNKKVVLKEAKVGGRISMQASTFNDKLNMRSVSIGSDLTMADATFDRVDLSRAKIAGYLNLEDSDFKGRFHMESASVRGDLLMGGKAKFERDVVLRGAKINGNLDMSVLAFRKSEGDTLRGDLVMKDYKFKGRLDMYYIKISGDLLMRNVKFKKPVNLAFLKVGSNLDLRGTTLSGLDLTGAKITEDLRLRPSSDTEIKWIVSKEEDKKSHHPMLILRNTSVSGLWDSKDDWPDDLELDGFTYKRFVTSGNETLSGRGSEWFVKWLEKDETYSPQPYQHLASVLQDAKLGKIADDILYAKRFQEIELSNPLQLVWWILLIREFTITIGYEYGLRPLLGLIWVAGFALIGASFLRYKKENYEKESGKRRGRSREELGFWYSLDMLLPVIRLREEYYQVDLKTTWVRIYFYFHKIIGYVLIYILFGKLPGL